MADLFLGAVVEPATHQRTEREVRIPTDLLTTHGVIVGMTGSGKTGLGVVLVEEVLSAGIPALLIDPKGDLTNLCLTFPDLSADAFRPWVDEGQARSAGVPPDEHAVAQAAAWTAGLADWGRGGGDIQTLRDRVTFTVYTPGSDAATPLDLVGSLSAPAAGVDDEVVADEIEGWVSGLLGLVGIDADPLASREHILLSNLIAHAWGAGRSLDLPTLVGMVADPPLRKLGVFELDLFFPPADRMTLAVRLNGLLASPSFAAWSQGPPVDIERMLFGDDGRPRCAIVTTAHLSDEERQFVTSMLLGKLITWMRGQSGTTDLRALLYMDEVMGYLPPTANPPTKQPILTLMKQARAFGVGVVLATQNPVDIDYKAISNAGTWLIGRLQTERDKQRLLDGMRSASGGVDVDVLGATISGLGKREFVLRRADRDEPVVMTTRWAMSYLRGPLTRDQLRALAPAGLTEGPASGAVSSTVPAAGLAAGSLAPAGDESAVPPAVVPSVPVRWIDPAAPWLTEVGGDPAGTRYEPALVVRVALRYDEAKADLVHDAEYEAVLFPLGATVDVVGAVAVDHDDRDLRTQPPAGALYRLTGAPLAKASFLQQVERDLVAHLVRSLTLELPANERLGMVGRPGESSEAFAARCQAAADERADAELATLRDRLERRATKLRDQLESAEDRADVLTEEAKGRRNAEVLSTAGSILGGLLGGRRSKGALLGTVLGRAGTAAGRRGRTTASERRVDAARTKIAQLGDELEALEDELEDTVTELAARWDAAAAEVTTTVIGLERSDVRVADRCVAWIPVA